MKKSEIKKLDKMWADAVKKRAGYKCEYCQEEGRVVIHKPLNNAYSLSDGVFGYLGGVWLNACHIVGRRYRATRWDLNNGVCLCYSCHKQYDEHGPKEGRIVKMIGLKRKEELQRKAKQTVAKYQDFEEIKRSLL